MSEVIRQHHEEQPRYLPVDTAQRTELEIGRLLEKHINRDEVIRYKESKGEEVTIHYRNQDERTAYIVQSTLIALEITPNTPDLFLDTDEQWKLDPAKRETALHALEVEKAVAIARNTLHDAQARLSKVEFGDFMMDVLDDVQKHKAHTDLYRAFRLLQTMSIDRDDLVPAHRVGLVMLHQTI